MKKVIALVMPLFYVVAGILLLATPFLSDRIKVHKEYIGIALLLYGSLRAYGWWRRSRQGPIGPHSDVGGPLIWLGLLAILQVSCDTKAPDPKVDDSPTSGHVTILADRAFEYLLEDHQIVFNGTYPKATVDLHYLPAAELARAMMHDSVRVVFAPFAPGAEQIAYFRTRQLSVKPEPVAVDAIAVLVAPGNTAERITLDQIREILAGTGTTRRAFFEKQGGVAISMADSIFNGQGDNIKNATAINDLDEMLDRIAADTAAIGFTSYAMLSDLDDPRCIRARQKVKILPVAASDTSAAVRPDQGTLKDGSYPLRRYIMMMVTEGKSGLGTGFASFVAGHKGQRIILKQGLAPIRIPARDVELVQPE